MRSAIVAAAFAAGVLAVPFNERRAQAPQYGDNVQTDVEVVYVTQVVTVTAGGDAPTYTTEAQHYGHKHSKKPVTTSTTSTYEAPAPPAYTPEPETTYEAPAPTYEAPASTYEAPASSAPAASSPAAPASGSYEDTCLYHHNLHRANHTAPALTWSEDLKNTAQKIAEGCNYAHDVEMDGGGYGQNIAAGVSADNISAVITDLFYNGEEPLFAQQYGKPDPDMDQFEAWGHFTQIVWSGTTEVGCFTADCSATGLGNTGSGVSPYFTVCNYKNPGNYAGEYQANVNAPTQNAPTANWDAGLSGLIPSSYKK